MEDPSNDENERENGSGKGNETGKGNTRQYWLVVDRFRTFVVGRDERLNLMIQLSLDYSVVNPKGEEEEFSKKVQRSCFLMNKGSILVMTRMKRYGRKNITVGGDVNSVVFRFVAYIIIYFNGETTTDRTKKCP